MRTPIRKNLLSGSEIALLLMLLPGLIWLFLLKYLPMGGVILAFKEFHFTRGGFFTSLINSPWVGWTNFKFLFATVIVSMSLLSSTSYANLLFVTI